MQKAVGVSLGSIPATTTAATTAAATTTAETAAATRRRTGTKGEVMVAWMGSVVEVLPVAPELLPFVALLSGVGTGTRALAGNGCWQIPCFTLLLRFPPGKCNYAHRCSRILANGSACDKQHRARDH